LIGLKRIVEAPNADLLTFVVVEALESGARIGIGELSSRLFYFWANGLIVFQGARMEVTFQLAKKHELFSIRVHYMVHRMNLPARTLSSTQRFQNVENLMAKAHAFYNHMPKKLYEFQKLADAINTKGLQPLKHVVTR
jgi:hypothetical protein